MLPKGEILQLIYRCKSDAYEFELLSGVALGTPGSNCAPWMNEWTIKRYSSSVRWQMRSYEVLIFGDKQKGKDGQLCL